MSNRNGRSLSSNVPAHKQTNPVMKPGQQVYPYTNPLGFVIQPSETTLKEYIARKQEKLTFENYWNQQGFDTDSFMLRLKHEFELCWKAAQENV